jgi:hypothetical protein
MGKEAPVFDQVNLFIYNVVSVIRFTLTTPPPGTRVVVGRSSFSLFQRSELSQLSGAFPS